MKDVSLFTFIKNNVEDNYAMNAFYYSIKKSFAERDFSFYGFSYFIIDGRFLGDGIKVSTTANYRTPVHSLSLLLSLRILMLDQKSIKLCEDDNLIFVSRPRDSFQWIDYLYLIMENWDDSEIKMLYQMMENYYYDEEFTEEEKEEFRKSIVMPEYKNERTYYQHLALTTNGVSDNVIGNNAFVEANIENYTISKDIEFVGNTAFSYCDKLKSLVFEGKVMFGTFPIIECTSLRQIIVPNEFVDYYKEVLPYYKEIIVTEEQIEIESIEKGEKNIIEPDQEAMEIGSDKYHYGDGEIKEDSDEQKSKSDSEWFFVESLPFKKASKHFLSYDCRVVLSTKGYYLEVTGDYIKLGDYPKGFSSEEGNIWIKKAVNEKGVRMVHDTEDDLHLIGYIREEENEIVFTNPDDKVFTITFSEE